jgi:hypothetical protein
MSFGRCYGRLFRNFGHAAVEQHGEAIADAVSVLDVVGDEDNGDALPLRLTHIR